MFDKSLKAPTKAAIVPGAGPQLPNDSERGRIHYIWDIFNPDTVKPGEEYRYAVPREKEMVVDPVIQQWYRVDHVAWESDLRSTLTPIFNSGSGGGDGQEGIFGMPAGFQGEGVVGIDFSVRPNRAVIDGQITAPGAAYALLYEGNNVGENGKVISVLYSNNNQIISNRVPVKLALYHDLTNKEIMITQPFSVNRNAEELPDGSRATLVFFDEAGNVIPRARSLSVQHTSMLRDHQVGKRYIRTVELVAPWFMNSGDPKTLQVPVNTMLQNLAFRAVVHYSDGSKSDELPIDGNKIILHGLNEHKPSTPGQRSTLTLVYNLDEDESIYEAQPGNPDQFRDSYWLFTIPFDGAYSPKIYSYPTWVKDQYVLKHFLSDLDREFVIDCTDYVRINENSPAFRPTTYGVEQTLELNLRLSDVVPTFKPMIMRQSTTFVLKAPGSEDGSKFDVRYSYDQRSYSDPTFHAINQADGRQEITFGEEYETLDEWLDAVYYAVEPGYNPQREKGPLVPTHYEVLTTSGKVYAYEVGRFKEPIHLEVQEPHGRTVFVRWVHVTTQDERLMLGTTGVSIDVVEGPSTETPVPTTVELDNSVPSNVGEGGVIEFSGIVYDQKGSPIVDGLTTMYVLGGTQHGSAPREVPIRLDGTFRFFTFSDLRENNTDTFNFGFKDKDGVLTYIHEKRINVKPNVDDIRVTVYPYSPIKSSKTKPARVYGYVAKADGTRLAEHEFHSYVNDDLDTFEINSTDENGDFVITRLHDEKYPSVDVIMITEDNTKRNSVTWADTESYGDRITLTTEDMSFVGDELMNVPGLVYDQYGDPVGSQRVHLGFGPNWESAADILSNQNGQYTLSGPARLPGDTYPIVVWTDNDFTFGTVVWTEAPKVAFDIILDPENVTEAPAGTNVSIKGRLVDDEGNDFISDSRTPVYMKKVGDELETIVYAGFDGHFQADVGPFGNWEETTFTFRIENNATASHKITWLGEPAKLGKVTFDAGLPVEGHVGVPVTLSGTTVDQYDELYAPGMPFEFDVVWGANTAKAQADGEGRWTFKAVGEDAGDTTYTFKSNNVTVGSYTIKFTGELTIAPLPSEASMFSVPVNMARTIGWYVLDETGKPKPGVEVEISKTMMNTEEVGTFVTDQYGIVSYEAPYSPDDVAQYTARLGTLEANIVVRWQDTPGIGVTIERLDAPSVTTLSMLEITGRIVDQNGDPVWDPEGEMMKPKIRAYDRKTFEQIAMSPIAPDAEGDFKARIVEWEFVDRDLVFFTEVGTVFHPISWVPPSIEGAHIVFDDNLADVSPAGTTVDIRGKVIQTNGELYQPRQVEQIPVGTDEGLQGDATIHQAGVVTFNATCDHTSTYTYYFATSESNIIGEYMDIYWTEGGRVTAADFSNKEVPRGTDAKIAFRLVDDNNVPISERTLVVTVDGVFGPNYVGTDEYGLAYFTVPYVEGRDTVTVRTSYNNVDAEHTVTWVDDTVKTGVAFKDMKVPALAQLGRAVTIEGIVLDKAGNPTHYGDVGIYHKKEDYTKIAAYNPTGEFSGDTLSQSTAGSYDLIVYTEGHYAEYTVTWDADFFYFKEVEIDPESNTVALITE